MNPLVLASISPRRHELLGYLNIPFQIVQPPFEEISKPGWDVRQEVAALARGKALSIAAEFPGHTLLAADTLVSLAGEKLGKPADAASALIMLKRLAGQVHEVMTGVCLSIPDRRQEFLWVEVTRVQMKKCSAATLKEYVASQEPMGKAGAYAIQGVGKNLIEKITGDYFNVVGLPLLKLYGHLQDLGFHPNISYQELQARVPADWRQG